jgi:3-oxoacyl-[acyl-carrier-protein] synthase II
MKWRKGLNPVKHLLITYNFNMSRRVVITGYGVVSPLGLNSKTAFENIVSSKSGISKIESFDTSDLEVHIAGEVKFASENRPKSNLVLEPTDFIPHKEIKKLDKFMIYAMVATEEALTMAGWKPTAEHDLIRTGVTIGSGIGGLEVIEETVLKMQERGPSKVSPFFIPSSLINLSSGHVSIKYGFLGPNHATVTACATGAHSIYNAAQMIMLDDADVVVCGGAESAICKIGIAGFSAAKALSSKYNDTPEIASRPWDADRDGFVMGEGAGVLVLEEYEHAKKRGATILGEYLGAGLSGDAYHITAPEPTGRGAKNAMKMALAKAKLNPSQIGYVNAHGTSTPLGDQIELNSVIEILAKEGNQISMSSTKGATGHLLGAAGSLEAIISIMAMNRGILPPTLNLHNSINTLSNVNLVPLTAQEKSFDYALSNSFGFGGTNVSLIFGKVK